MSILFGVVRHVLTTAGGALVGTGTLTGSEVEAAVGAILTLIGIAASVWAKRTVS